MDLLVLWNLNFHFTHATCHSSANSLLIDVTGYCSLFFGRFAECKLLAICSNVTVHRKTNLSRKYAKIQTEPNVCWFLDYHCSKKYMYLLPTFWCKSNDRARCRYSTLSVYFPSFDQPSIMWAREVITWCQCYHGNRGSLMNVKLKFSAWAHSQTKLGTVISPPPPFTHKQFEAVCVAFTRTQLNVKPLRVLTGSGL